MPHVTFIHGIANKPAPDVLLNQWRRALAADDGISLGTRGITSSMVYWADVLYERPLEESAAQESLEGRLERTAVPAPPMEWRGGLAGPQKDWVDRLAARFRFETAADDDYEPPEEEIGFQLERVPLPGWVKRHLMQVLLRDVHHYLFNARHSPRPGVTYQVQQEIRNRLIRALQEGGQQRGPHILISHSMGTVIAYDCLKRVPDCPRIDGLITIGSPLGLDEIQDQMQPEWSREDGFPRAKLAGDWVNVYDIFDPVAGFDPALANDYRRASLEVVEDINEQNYGKWRHDLTKYFSGPKFRARLREMLGI